MNLVMKKCLFSIVLLALAILQVQPAQAARGIPGSPEFGFGVSLYPDGPMLDEALNLLSDLHPDWLYVPVSWAAVQPSADVEPDLAFLDRIMSVAAGQQTAVAISLSQVPGWALTGEGPDPELAARFAALLAQRYPQVLQALELFPRANTLTGWGSAPSPKAYLALYQVVQNRLNANGSTLLLAAAGLQPVADGEDPSTAMDDLDFLQGLYDAGGANILRVISLQCADASADLLASPYRDSRMIFRRYETVRERMLDNQHTAGLIWVTGLGLPSGAYGEMVTLQGDLLEQQSWLQQAYYQTNAQLYIGTAVLQSLNPAPENAPFQTASLLQSDGSRHPFYDMLREMTTLRQVGAGSFRPGSSKKGNLLKNRP